MVGPVQGDDGTHAAQRYPLRCRKSRAGWKALGFRTIILFRAGERTFFVHGYAKNEQDNISDQELAAFRMLAAHMLSFDDEAIAKALANGTLTEVNGDDQAVPKPSDGLDP